MDKPRNNEEIQLVAVLRLLDRSQDYVASALHIAKRQVGNIEDWIKAGRLESVEAVFDDQALKRTIGRELPILEEIEPHILIRAGQVTADDILQHYRTDYQTQARKSGRPPNKKRKQHFKDLSVTALILASSFEDYLDNFRDVIRDMAPYRTVEDAVVSGWFNYEFEESDLNLLDHLKGEFTELVNINDWGDLTTDNISDDFVARLKLKANQRDFSVGKCPACPT